jgi:tRNA threonylcarbamoyladenosine biosynthesis protein TsaB
LIALQMKHEQPDAKLFVPMIDARRMEVYTAAYGHVLNSITEPHALILDEHSFADEAGKTLVFGGDGAEKCKSLSFIPNIIYSDVVHPLAQHMCPLSYEKFTRSEFENVAYFEPFYLKEFQVKTKKSGE